MTLRDASTPLPVAWDGRAVKWDAWEKPVFSTVRFHPKPERCTCGSVNAPFTSRGLRDTDPDRVRALERLPRIGRRTKLAWPVYDLHAFRCPDCGEVTVWDMATDEVWTLDESDLGPTGSWAWSGGLLDALLIPASADSSNGENRG